VVRAQGAFARVSGPWAGVGTGASFAVLGILAHNLVHYFLRDPVDGLMTGIVLGLVVSVARRAALSPDATVDAIAEASA
jgi:hypothetical protein